MVVEGILVSRSSSCFRLHILKGDGVKPSVGQCTGTINYLWKEESYAIPYLVENGQKYLNSRRNYGKWNCGTD